MKRHSTSVFFFLLLLLLGLVWLGQIIAKKYDEPVPLEAFSNVHHNMDNNLLVSDTYPAKQPASLSDENARTLASYYPTFTLGSYEQITNNLKHVLNPDIGRCMPASMCGALYHDKKDQGTNVVTPLPPVTTPEGQTRVGYFNTVGENAWL